MINAFNAMYLVSIWCPAVDMNYTYVEFGHAGQSDFQCLKFDQFCALFTAVLLLYALSWLIETCHNGTRVDAPSLMMLNWIYKWHGRDICIFSLILSEMEQSYKKCFINTLCVELSVV